MNGRHMLGETSTFGVKIILDQWCNLLDGIKKDYMP